MNPCRLAITTLFLLPLTANAALWKTPSSDERRAAQVRKSEYRTARAEMRSAVRGSSTLVLRHARSLAAAAGVGAGLGLMTGGGIAYTAAIPDMMDVHRMSKTAAGVALVLSAATAVVSTPIYYRWALPRARSKTVRLGVQRGLIARDRALAWEKAGLLDSEWRQRYAFDGLPIYEAEK